MGKTSLVAQFVHSMFSDKYFTTVGVKIDKKSIDVDGTEVTLVIWDLVGDDDFQRLQTSCLRGTSDYLLVADGTRRVTLEQALELQKRVAETLAATPFVLAVNKADLAPQRGVEEARMNALAAENFTIMRTSAKEGTGVEEAFAHLARRMTAPA